MSREGPRLRCCPKGYAWARFNGRKLHFGRHDDPQAHRRFAALKSRWEDNDRELTDDMLPQRARSTDTVTVAGLCEQHVAHLRERHTEERLRNNFNRIELSQRTLRTLYGEEPAANFSPKRLQTVRQNMLASGKLCRREINERIRIIVRTFRWAVAEELVPAEVHQGLAAVDPLKHGEYGSHEGRKVQAVDWETVAATLPHLSTPVTAIVQILWWTGARPSELFGLRPADIDCSGDVWTVVLDRHKTAGRGKRRALFFGPNAQRVLKPFLRRPKDQPLFRPAEAVEEMERRKRAARKTPLYPSHLARYERQRAQKPDRDVGDVYTATALRKAVERAVRAENRERAERGELPIPKWTPYQLRHAAATRIEREFDLETAAKLLGHSRKTTTERYVAVDLALARAAMAQAG